MNFQNFVKLNKIEMPCNNQVIVHHDILKESN